MTTEPSTAPFKILSLDGGGVRGAFSASALASLEMQFGVRLIDHFDLLVGTSTGGIIALALAAGLPATAIREFYRSAGPRIFAPMSGPLRLWRLVSSIVRPKHSQAPLRAALQEVFGDRTIAALKTRVVIPAFSATAGRIRLFKTPHHKRLTRDHSRTLVEVALATSAAPYFLPGLSTNEGERFIDGGVWANNPIAVGVVEAIGYMGIPARCVRVLSIGTTNEPFHIDARVVGAGLIGLLFGALRGQSVGLFMAGQTSAAYAQAKVLLGGDEAIVRVDNTVANGRFSLDRAADIQELCGLGEDAATNAAPQVREAFLDRPAAYPFRAPGGEPAA